MKGWLQLSTGFVPLYFTLTEPPDLTGCSSAADLLLPREVMATSWGCSAHLFWLCSCQHVQQESAAEWGKYCKLCSLVLRGLKYFLKWSCCEVGARVLLRAEIRDQLFPRCAAPSVRAVFSELFSGSVSALEGFSDTDTGCPEQCCSLWRCSAAVELALKIQCWVETWTG